MATNTDTDTALEMELDRTHVSQHDVAMLSALLDDDETPPAPAKRGPKVKVDLASMTTAERLRHNADLTAVRRQAKRELMSAGSLKGDEQTIRDALADAALMILASDAEGSALVMAYLEKVFKDKVGVPFTVRAEAKGGKMRPKLLQFAKP